MDRATKERRDEEFAVFMAGSGPALMRTATLLTGNTDAAQELVQAALVKVYGAWERVRADSALAYARRALVNQHRHLAAHEGRAAVRRSARPAGTRAGSRG